ncbi:5-oxoprolinase subunit PxpB [Azospirillum sp. ST 5-10]|uniref:5-oxoprolinase subunit PxpB n=1 Tax=unclassified Azospirillum TaxID=2630922 RepID=UPI003F4A4767
MSRSPTPPRLLPAGDAALVIELGDGIAPELNEAVQCLDRRIAAAHLPGVVETVPTYRSLLLTFDPVLTSAEQLTPALLDLAQGLAADPATTARRWVIPVRFGGARGEDLDAVARHAGLSTDEVVRLHCAADYRVYMLGFSPGFAYLGGLPDALHLPRRQSPRLSTPAGSLMQGGAQAAVSPVAMPSGWHLLGRTPLRVFDLRRERPFLLAPGDRVRFTAIDDGEYERLAAAAERGEAVPGAVPGTAARDVVEAVP